MTGPFFHDATLAQMRQLSDASLPHSAAIQTASVTHGPGGITTETWTTTDTQPCRLAPSSGPSEAVQADQVRAAEEYQVTFAYGVDVSAMKRLVVTHTIPGIPSPMTLDVAGPLVRTYEMARTVLARKV